MNLYGVGNFEDTIINATICYGSDYNENGFNLTNQTTSTTQTTTLQTANGCDSTVTLNLTVFPQVTETFFNATICYGGNYTENGFYLTNQTASSTQTQTLQNVNGCDSIVTLNLTVMPYLSTVTELTAIHFNSGHKIYWNAVASADSYEIYRNGEFLATVSSANYQDNDLIKNNTYCYKVRAINNLGCVGSFTSQQCITATETTAIENLPENSLSIYPNPVKDVLHIDIPFFEKMEYLNAQIYDISGRTVGALRATPTDNGTATINVSNLSSGVYFLKIGDKRGKFVKE